MIAPPRSPSGRSSSHTVELQTLSRTAAPRPGRRRHTSQTLVGYAIPSTTTPGGVSGIQPSRPPPSAQVAIPPPIVEEPPATTQQTPGQLAPGAAGGAPLPSPNIPIAEPQPVGEGTWAKISAIASLYQAFLATIQTACGISFGVAAIVVGVKALQLAQLQYCEDHKTDNPTFFCKLLIRAGVESTAIFKRDNRSASKAPRNLAKFLSGIAAEASRLLPSEDELARFLGPYWKGTAWVLFQWQWERVAMEMQGLASLFAPLVDAIIRCAKLVVALLAWRTLSIVQLLDKKPGHGPRLTFPYTPRSRIVAASKPLILGLVISDAFSTAGGWLLLLTGATGLFFVAAVAGSIVVLVLVAGWSLELARERFIRRRQKLSGWEVGAQVAVVLSLLGLAHGTNLETGPVVFFSICQLALSLGSFVAAGYHRFEWRKLARLDMSGNELMGVIHVMLTVGDIFFPNKITLWALW